MPRRLLVTLAALLLLATTATAQTPEYEMPEPEVKTKIVTVAIPVVVIEAVLRRTGAISVSRVAIDGARGSVARISCAGRGCPFKSLRKTVKRGPLRIGRLEGKLRPGVKLTFRIARPGQLGKFVRYEIRRRKSPKRTDACLDKSGERRDCFA